MHSNCNNSAIASTTQTKREKRAYGHVCKIISTKHSSMYLTFSSLATEVVDLFVFCLNVHASRVMCQAQSTDACRSLPLA